MTELKKLISDISQSVQTAQNSIQDHNVASFLRHFDAEEKKDFAAAYTPTKEEENTAGINTVTVMTPKVVHFNLTNSEDGTPLDVPAVTLTRHNAMALDTVQVTLNVSAGIVNNKLMVDVESAATPGQAAHQVVLNFKNADAAEGMSRILDCTNQFA